MVARAVVLPTDVPLLLDEARRLGLNGAVHAFAGTGVLWLKASAGDVAAFAQWRRWCEARGGHLLALGVPPEHAAALPPWGAPRADWPLMDRIRTTLDPHRRLNPGRFCVA